MDGLECSEIMLRALERTTRMDAEFYQKGNLAILSSLHQKQLQPFTQSFTVSDGNHMSISKAFCSEGIPYYRGQDSHSVFIEESAPVCIDRATFNHPHMLRSHLKAGDVLVSIVGTVGNAVIVSSDVDATCSCKLAILRNRSGDVNAETLLTFIKTSYGQNQIQKFKRGAVQTGLLLEDFDQLVIPWFSTAFQERIRTQIRNVHDMTVRANELYTTAQQRLLHALKFEPQSISVSGIAEKPFSTAAAAGRLDAEYYQPKYDDLLELLDTSPTETLGGLVTIGKSIEPGSAYYTDTGIPFIRVSDVSPMGIQPPSIHIPPSIEPSIERLYPRRDTILFSKDGSVGIAYKVEEDLAAVTSGALLHLRLRDEVAVLPDYLALVLNSDIVRLQAERDTNGSVIEHWSIADIERVVIPLLSLPIQREIAAQVQQSFALRRSAEQGIAAAVRAVEIAVEEDEAAALSFLAAQG